MKIKLLKKLFSAIFSVTLFKMATLILVLFAAANVAIAARYMPDIKQIAEAKISDCKFTENVQLTSVCARKTEGAETEEGKHKVLTHAANINAIHVVWHGSSSIDYGESIRVLGKAYRCESSKKGRCAIIK